MKFEMSECCCAGPEDNDAIDFTPDDINLTDDASFVWEIEE